MKKHDTNTAATLVVQMTGRLHFGAARALEQGGLLTGLLTDFYIPSKLAVFAKFNATLERYVIPLPSEKIFGNPLLGLDYRLNLHFSRPYSSTPHIRTSKLLAWQTRNILRTVDVDTVFSFDIQALETFNVAQEKGLRCALEQCVAPRKSQIEILSEFSHIIPDDELQYRKQQLEILAKREDEEWYLADLVICPSTYVAGELERWGVPKEKLRLVPYGFDRAVKREPPRQRDNSRVLRGVFVGTLEPRKGIHLLVEAAKILGAEFELDVYGPTKTEEGISDWGSSIVRVHGKVPFSIIEKAYLEADYFILPSYLEGSATVVYEAMSYGLPCVVTPQVGSVIKHGHDGLVIPSADVSAIVKAVQLLNHDRQLLASLSREALITAKKNTLKQYGKRLCAEF